MPSDTGLSLRAALPLLRHFPVRGFRLKQEDVLKKLVSPEEYIALLNEELMRRPDRQEGMEFVPSPEGARGSEIAGYTLKNMDGRKDIFAAVSQKIFLQYRTV